ncbi:MAG: non-ribosomal peptide synthetase [Tetrasphaera sp.]|nr:non-ribosomal peptide synthetase [Tetrasphaera sp.]
MSLTARIDAALTTDPTRVALRHGDRSWTAAELDTVTIGLAHGLVSQGAGRNEIVEIDTDDHVEAILLMIATLRAGAAFCVVPPAYPAARVAAIRARTRPAVVVAGLAAALEYAADAPEVPLPVRADDDLAYVIFTSGSTGDPKAVEIVDRGLHYLADLPGVYPGQVVAHLAALQFDACIYEIIGSLLNAKTIAVLELDDVLDRSLVTDTLTGIDVFFVTTQVFNLLVDRSPEALERVRIVLFGGERVSPRHVRAALGRTRVVHAYGPTETTVFATMHEVTQLPEGADVPIGAGLLGTCVHVVDAAGVAHASGQGELVIGGTGLMRGYRDQPEATAKAMISLHGEPHYRSGDIVEMDADGVCTFVGRADRQVKVSGFRIDLFEIEEAALAFGGGPSGERLSRAFAVADQGKLRLFVTGCTSVAGLRAHLRATLPHYMVPMVTPVGAIPLTHNGKTDVAELVRRAGASNPRQERAREVFARLVPEDTPAEATFLDLGGDSLAAMDAIWQLDQAGIPLDMTALLSQPLERVLRDVA